MKYQFVEITKDLTAEEMKSRTDINTRTIKILNEEVNRLKLASLKEERAIYDKSVTKIDTKQFIEEKFDDDASLLEEINYYYSKITSLEDGISINEMLPSKKNPNYQNIIYGICALLLKENNEIKIFIESEKDNLTKEELTEFKDEILVNQIKINLIKETEAKIEKENTLEEKKEASNNIVFLETPSGNIYAKDDLNPNIIPTEYYSGFYELIKSIEDGTFKNVKMLASNNNKTSGIAVVRGFKRRVIFDRIGYNTYVILAVFVKKSVQDKSYLEPLKHRISIYRKRRDALVDKIKDDCYLEGQQEILEGLYKTLNQEEEKTLKKGLK